MESVNYSDMEKKEGPSMESTDKEKDEPQTGPSTSSASSVVHNQETTARTFCDDSADDEVVKKKKRKENTEKETMSKPTTAIKTSGGRTLTGTKIPGPASKTGATPLKSLTTQSSSKTTTSSGKGTTQTQSKGSSGQTKMSQGSHQGKSASKSTSTTGQGKSERKSPIPSPKPTQTKETEGEEEKSQEATAPKVPPLKIVIPGGAGSGARNETEGDGAGGARGPGKGRNSASTLPYILPCTNTDTGPLSDSSDGNSEEKRMTAEAKAQRVLRSHRTNDEKDGSPQAATNNSATVTTQPTTVTTEEQATTTSSTNTQKSETTTSTSVELHPRKRKIKVSKEMREAQRDPPPEPTPHVTQTVQHCNPYQQFIQIQKQIEKRQRALFPVKPKPPKDFNNYLMNTCTYTLQGEGADPPPPDVPTSLPAAMKDEYLQQEAERVLMRSYHQVEKEKLVLAVEQEILRVHGRAERAVANQSQPYSVCTILRDQEVYNLLAPEQEEKRNAQRSRCNGRQINSWLQEVDDKWEKIKEGMLKRQHIEAETLYASQIMDWEWKLKELALCDCKVKPKIDPAHVPQVHVGNFDLPA